MKGVCGTGVLSLTIVAVFGLTHMAAHAINIEPVPSRIKQPLETNLEDRRSEGLLLDVKSRVAFLTCYSLSKSL